MIGLILAKKIFSMFLIIFSGFILVKGKIVKVEESKILSIITLYLIMPCSFFNALIVDYRPEVLQGLILAVAASILIHIWMILVTLVLGKFLGFSEVEQASIVYSNAGNLVLPIVTTILGSEWVIYSIGFITIQNFLFWSHGKTIISGEKCIDIRKIITNINIIVIIIGLILFLTGLRFPAPVHDAIGSVGGMIGPIAMLVTGMLMGSVSWKKIFSYHRMWLVILFRLIICPLGAVLFVKYSGITTLVPSGQTVLLVTLLAAMAPAASSVTQMAQVYDRNADYASAINVISTLLCIVTMPLLVTLYQW